MEVRVTAGKKAGKMAPVDAYTPTSDAHAADTPSGKLFRPFRKDWHNVTSVTRIGKWGSE